MIIVFIGFLILLSLLIVHVLSGGAVVVVDVIISVAVFVGVEAVAVVLFCGSCFVCLKQIIVIALIVFSCVFAF